MRTRTFLLAAGLLCGATPLITGCAASSTLWQRGAKGPDSEVVSSFVCRGEAAAAEVYLQSLGMPLSDRIAAIERARMSCPAQKEK